MREGMDTKMACVVRLYHRQPIACPHFREGGRWRDVVFWRHDLRVPLFWGV